MKGWELFKKIVAETGIYKKKALFFLALVFASLAFGFIWQKYRHVEAAVDFPTPQSGYSNQVKMDVTISQNAEVFINGQKKNDVLKFYENFDEVKILVFNAPGYYVQNFQATVTLPKAEAHSVRQIIYAVHGVGSNRYKILDEQTLFYEATDISPRGVVTIVADLPKGMVQPNFKQQIMFQLKGLPLKAWLYVSIILPIITIILMAFMIIKRRAAQIFFVSDEEKELPAKEVPAVVGVLVDGSVGAREITATLIDLAKRGFIIIVNKGRGEFSFGKLRASDIEKTTGLEPFEKALLSKIFLAPAYKSTLGDVEMRIGRHIFSRRIAQFYLGIYNYATQKGYFVRNPAKVHLVYKYIGLTLLFLSLVGFAIGAVTGADPKFSLLFWVGGMIAAFFVIKLSPFMPARSTLGTVELRKWLAFRKYLSSKKSLQAKDILQSKFEEYLPYAVVLGAEVNWARRFLKEPFVAPKWYETIERVVTLESFIGEFFPFIGYVAENLARSHEPTVE